MARKITERERLITFVLSATTEQLTEAKEMIDTALRTRQPKTSRAASSRGLKRIERKHTATAGQTPVQVHKEGGVVVYETERNPPPED